MSKPELPRFLADKMLGTLAKKLRLLGLDTSYSSDSDNNEIRYLVKSQGRILLTRDVKLAKSLGEHAWLVTGGNVREEFLDLSERLSRFRYQIKPFSKCLECNELLQLIDPSFAQEMVPPYVFQAKKIFSRCFSCGKIFWDGTHRKRMEEEVKWMRDIIVRG